jgi:hypothetical protein
MKVPFSPAAFILPVWKVEGHELTFGVNVLMLSTFDIWLWKEVSKAEQITCGSTQTYEHNTYSPLRKSTLQQSKQEAKVSSDQTAPVCCSQPSENTDRSNSLKCTYYLNCPEDCASSANWGCLQWRLQMSAIRWIPWTELPFQRMHTARKKSWTCVLNKDHLFFVSAGVEILFTNRI